MPENFTTEDYLNTTNPYSNLASAQGALDEVDDPEGSNPLYVLVFGDEERRGMAFNWMEYATFQLERGDEALVANFGIDIRILGFLEWDSNDSIEYMDDPYEWDLCDELLADKGHYLRTWYDGEWWSNYVDAIIGLTGQSTPADDPPTAGVAPSLNELNQGIIFVLLKWLGYWMDDNLVQHEVSHLYYAPDHPEPQPPAPCCAMAYHPHFQSWIWEDGLWWVFADIPCAYTAYSWCTNCHQTIQQNSGRYPLRTLTISASSGGTTNPTPGTYIYGNGSSVTVTATAYTFYVFDYWLLDGSTYYQNPITVTMDSDHTLTAYFQYSGGGGGCPYVYTWDGQQYVMDNNLLPASETSNGADVEDRYMLEQPLVPMYQVARGSVYSLQIREFEHEHDYFDQVKLLAVDHSSNVNVAVSPYGEILTYSNPAPPISAVDKDGINVLSQLSSVDGNYYQGYNGSHITITFTSTDVSNGIKLVIRDDLPPVFEKCPVYVQVLNATGDWNTVATFHTRTYWATDIINMTGYLPDPEGNLKVRLCFVSTDKIDYVGLDTTPQASIEVHQAFLLSAFHSTQGNVKRLLVENDQTYAELIPGEQIQLTFRLQNNQNEERTFILYTEGHYSTIAP